MSRRPQLNRVALVIAAVMLLVIGFAAWNICKPRHDARLEAIRRAGQPVTLAELDAWYPHIPDSQNAALIYTNAFAHMLFTESSAGSGKVIDDIKLPPRGILLAGEDKVELARMISSNAAALHLLYSAQHLTNSRYPIDLKLGYLTLLPQLSHVKGATRLLTVEAILHAANNEREPAVQSLLCALRVQDSLKSEPLLISDLVRIASTAIIISQLERVINTTALTEAELAQLQIALADAEQPLAAARALIGERTTSLAFFDDRRSRYEMLNDLTGTNLVMVARLKSDVTVFLLQMSGLLEKDRAYFLDALMTNIASVNLDYPARFTESKRTATLLSAAPNRFYIFSSMILPALSKYYSREARHTTLVRVATTALAIERYRLAHADALPATLDDLVPAYLKTVPLDPCDGQKLRFKKLTKGYVVYGIGIDGIDDGGLERKVGGGQSNFDITFFVER